jgi:hypothetical protein
MLGLVSEPKKVLLFIETVATAVPHAASVSIRTEPAGHSLLFVAPVTYCAPAHDARHARPSALPQQPRPLVPERHRGSNQEDPTSTPLPNTRQHRGVLRKVPSPVRAEVPRKNGTARAAAPRSPCQCGGRRTVRQCTVHTRGTGGVLASTGIVGVPS